MKILNLYIMKKDIKLKFFSIAFGLLISLILGEFVARIYFFGNATFSYSKINSFGILDNSNLIKYANSKELTYELLPNLNTKYKLVSFKTNNKGFRDSNHNLKLKSNTKRVAIIGDSFTMGTGVSQENLYVQKTAGLLNKSDSKNTFEFFNFGVSGYALNDYLTVLKNNTLKYNPDLIVIGFCASNDQFVLGTDYNLDNFTIKPKKNVFWNSYLKKLLNIKLNKKKANHIVYKKHQLQFVSDNFKKLKEILNAAKIKGIIYYLDLIYDSKRVNQIKAIAQENDLLFLDVSIFFKEKKINQYILNELDPHPNDEANNIFAKYLNDFILKNENLIFEL